MRTRGTSKHSLSQIIRPPQNATSDSEYAFCGGLPNHIQYGIGQKNEAKVPNFYTTFTQSYLGCPESFLRSVKA